MKNFKVRPIAFLLFAVISLISCNDVEPVDPTVLNPPTPSTPTGGSFKVNIDGVLYTASAASAYISGGSIQITATRAQGDTFGMLLYGTTAATYQTNANIVAYSPAGSEFGYWGVNPDDPEAPTGTVTVTSINTAAQTISGTFTYTGYWSDSEATGVPPKEFTGGVFTNLPYVTENPSDDTFLAKVNTVDFNQNDLLVLTIGAGTDEFIAIGASNALGAEMTVAIRSSVGLGTHPITGSDLDNAQLSYAAPADLTQTRALVGSVTVQEKTASTIKGVFSGAVTVGGITYVITAGSFDVEY